VRTDRFVSVTLYSRFKKVSYSANERIKSIAFDLQNNAEESDGSIKYFFSNFFVSSYNLVSAAESQSKSQLLFFHQTYLT